VAPSATLTAAVDTLGHTERVQQALQFLAALLDQLARAETIDGDSDFAELWPDEGLAVVSTIVTCWTGSCSTESGTTCAPGDDRGPARTPS
jgi:hypothetical protein